MKHVKLFEQFITEGIHDPGILKAFFMAGGPGSGKSYVATEMFDFPKGAISSVSYATGLKLVNSDSAFEKMMREAGIDAGKLADYANDPEKWAEVMQLRDKAKNITKRMQDNYIFGRLGQVIDGTGKNYDKIRGHRQMYQDLGYDTYMVFVNTSLEVALERNQKRERSVPEDLVRKMWQEVQANIGKFQNLFGANRMLIVDNSSYDNKGVMDRTEREINKLLRNPVENPLGKVWLRENNPKNARFNQPF
jgi:predicted kinase